MGKGNCSQMSRTALFIAAGSACAGGLLSLVRAASCKEVPLPEESAVADRRLVIGIDLGATTINVGLFAFDGSSRGALSRPITDWSFAGVVKQIVSVMQSVLDTAQVTTEDIDCIGIGSPGSLDTDKGIVRKAANFDWVEAPLTHELSVAMANTPVVLLNDAEAALQGEVWNGVAVGKRHVVMLTLGSGIGGGILVDKKVVRGCSGLAGELGHAIMKIGGRMNEGTGVRGVSEEYGSCGGIKRHAEKLLASADASSILKQCVGDESVSSVHVYEAAAKGCAVSTELLREVHEVIGVLCLNVCRFYDPEIIVLSGGLTNAGGALLEPVRTCFKEHHWNVQPSPSTPIVYSTSSATSGAAYGALLVLHAGEFA